jgi:hypothetical protein
MSERALIEAGDIFFFSRLRRGVDGEIEPDVLRLFMVLAPRGPGRKLRVFVVGRKLQKEDGESTGIERAWAVNLLTTSDAWTVRRELQALDRRTRTRAPGLAAAHPVGQGLYEIVSHKEHTELGYVLALPADPGPAQRELGILAEALYVVAVKNPRIPAAGLPVARAAGYPATLVEKFGDKKWIAVDDDGALLDSKNAQLLLIGANAPEDELGLQVRRDAWCDAFAALHARRAEGGCRALFTNVFPETEAAAWPARQSLVPAIDVDAEMIGEPR